jgi:hypothetical protein
VAIGGIATMGTAAVIAYVFPSVVRYRMSVSEANPPAEPMAEQAA